MSKVNHRHMKAATGANLDATDDQVVRRLIGREAIEFETPAKEAKTSPLPRGTTTWRRLWDRGQAAFFHLASACTHKAFGWRMGCLAS
jgi:hypothetical protein